MEQLSDEVMRAILSYCPSVEDLKSFGLTNQRWYTWMFVSEASDRLFLELYSHHYHYHSDTTSTQRQHTTTTTTSVPGRQLWKNLYHIRHGLRQYNYPNHPHPHHQRSCPHHRRGSTATTSRTSRGDNARPGSPPPLDCNCTITTTTTTTTTSVHRVQTIGILPLEEEKEALGYDHHNVFFGDLQEHQACVGYFGMQPIIDKEERVAIWGDFAGLRVAPSWEALLNSQSNDRDQLIQLQDEKQTQVMDFQVHPSSGQCFLAFASGVVMIATTIPEDRELKVLDSAAVHDSEITCLAFVPPSNNSNSNNNNSSSNRHPGYLLSADVSGNVCLYPDSLTRYSLKRQVWLNACLAAPRRIPIFSMSATIFHSNKIVLCTGGQGLKVSLWELEQPNNNNNNNNNTNEKEEDNSCWNVITRTDYDCEDDLGDEELEEDEEEVEHNVTKVSFVGPITTNSNHFVATKPDLLVLGTSRGHIVSLDLLGHDEDPYQPYLEARSCLKRAHAGSVESMTRIGNLVLTTGGKDGNVRASDLVTGASVASLLVHPGQLCETRPPRRLKSAVVSSYVCHERQSIICLCRDGHISEWSFQVQTLPTGGVKRGSALAAPKTAKRSRRAKRNSSQERLSNHETTSALVESSPSAAANPGGEEEDAVSLLDGLSENIKDYFNQIGFVKWAKLQLPVLVLSPLSVPPGMIRDAWLKAYHQFQQKNNKMPPLLVYWYGALDVQRAYSIVSASKFTSYEQGVAKGFHTIPAQIQRRLDTGLIISASQQEYVAGLRQLPLEAAKSPMDRSHLFHL